MRNLSLSRFEGKISHIVNYNYNSPIPSVVYKLKDGSMLKIFDAELLKNAKPFYDLEKKVLDADNIHGMPELILPTAAIYNDATGLFTGYTMPCAKGKNYTEYYNSLSVAKQLDLKAHANLYSSIEKVVKRANMKDIIFPDLCTTENIFINNNKISFIDYDGLQVGNHNSLSLCSLLGDEHDLLIPKYYDKKNGLFNSNLDKRSLIILYFITVFNIDLNQTTKLNFFNDSRFLELFKMINLDDEDIQEKIWKAFQPTGDNEYLGDDVFTIANNYKLVMTPSKNDPSFYQKTLIKK